MVWYGMVWYGMVWYGMVWYGMVWYGRYGTVRYVTLRYVTLRYGTIRYGKEDVVGRARDSRPTIVFTTIDHPIMREWAAPGVDVEVFPSGLVLDKMDSSAVSGVRGDRIVGVGVGVGVGVVVDGVGPRPREVGFLEVRG